MAVQNTETNKIRQLVFLSYHTQAWLGTHHSALPAYHDCIYNAACEMSHARILDATLFWTDARDQVAGGLPLVVGGVRALMLSIC